jgi:rhamnosyltransferase subunit B
MRPVDIQTCLPAEIHSFRDPSDPPAAARPAHELLGLGNNLHSSHVHVSFMRSKRRIVLSTLGSLGDLHPVMGLALGLQARGHDVVLATSDFYREKILAAGLEFSPLRPLAAPDDPQMLRRVLDSRKGPEYLIRTLLLPHVGDMYADMSRATEGADFLISGEVVLAAPLIAEKRRIPWAAAILAPFSFFSAHDPPVLPFLPGTALLTSAPPFIQRRLLDVFRLVTRNWGEPIAELRRSLGLRPSRDPLLLDRFSPHLNLAMFSSVLGRPQPDWPPNTVQTGFVFYDEESDAASESLQKFLDSGPQPIIFTLGSTAVMDPGRFFEESAAAARLLGRRALLLTGTNPPPAGLSKDLFATGYAPYSRVFPQSACVVHQGGVGTTAQALRAGVPQLVMPYAFDQPDNAARVSRIGVGLSLSRKRYRADQAAMRLDQLLTKSTYDEHARDGGRRVGRENGACVACETVERAMAALCQSAVGV